MGLGGKFAMERKKACKLGNTCKAKLAQAELRCLGLETLPFAGFQAQSGTLHTRLMAVESELLTC